MANELKDNDSPERGGGGGVVLRQGLLPVVGGPAGRRERGSLARRHCRPRAPPTSHAVVMVMKAERLRGA